MAELFAATGPIVGDERVLEQLNRYLAALERGVSGAELAEYFTADAREQGMPNPFSPRGDDRPLAEMLAASERGRQLFSAQRYELLSGVATAEWAAIEVLWTGTLAVAIDKLTVGSQLRARVALFFELRDGRIALVRHYDSYEPRE
jgi:ketosteroid isomerase-like protein